MALKDWKKVRGAKASWEKGNRWISITKLRHNGGYVVNTTKEGWMDIIGETKTKTGAMKITRQYMRTH